MNGRAALRARRRPARSAELRDSSPRAAALLAEPDVVGSGGGGGWRATPSMPKRDSNALQTRVERLEQALQQATRGTDSHGL
jgi:hypothetical protein